LRSQQKDLRRKQKAFIQKDEVQSRINDDLYRRIEAAKAAKAGPNPRSAAGQGPAMSRHSQQPQGSSSTRSTQNLGRPSFAATNYQSGARSSRPAGPSQNPANPSFVATGYRSENRSSRRVDPTQNAGLASFAATGYQSENMSARPDRPSGRVNTSQYAGPSFGPPATQPYRGSHRSGRGGGLSRR
jgi:hypothetical protein